jgi:hypothetical protein
MTTLEHRAPELISDYWMAALKFRATGRTSRALRVMAADDEMTRGLALMSGVTQDEERAQVTGIADAIDVLEAHGLTPEDCYNLAGLDKLFGRPFAEFDPDANLGHVPARRIAPALQVTS